MARPIRNTPILFGKDAKMFLAEIEQQPSLEDRRKERARIEVNVERLATLIMNLKKQ
ncbi:MAG: hypothetical protein J6C87_05735 [Bacteroides sp.]|nr:hypothetical protein [Bacteroides sp.]